MIDDRNEKIQEFKRHSKLSKVGTCMQNVLKSVSIWALINDVFCFQEKTLIEIDESEALFKTLMSHVVDTQEKLKQNIELKLRKARDKDKAMIEELRDEIDQLERNLSELEDLTKSEDPLQLLQVFYFSICFISILLLILLLDSEGVRLP